LEVRPGYFLFDGRKGGIHLRKGFKDLEEAKTFAQVTAMEIKNKGTEAAILPDRLRVAALESAEILGSTSLVEAARFTEGFVRVVPEVAKMRRQRLVEIASNAQAWLLPYRRDSGPVRNFSKSTYRRRLARVLEKAELVLPYIAGRHAFASYHLALKAPEETAKQLGHASTDLIFTTYRGLVTKKAAETFWAIRPKKQSKLIMLDQEAVS
jgi:hypothetical protein